MAFIKFILLTVFSITLVMIHGQQVPCVFFFGDSQFDNGNNNMLATQAKANYAPYGIDTMGSSPTGRFTNGENIADFLAKFLGFAEPIPPFATARGSAILKGVNYASGAAGILKKTGNHLGARISMDRQLRNHRLAIKHLAPFIKHPTRVTHYLNKCLYVINMGSNDYINNYLPPQSYPSTRRFTPNQFAKILIHKFSHQLKRLYHQGARKVVVFGLGPLGCVLQELVAFPPTNGSSCVDFINNYVQLFNKRLVQLISELNSDDDLPGASFTYINMTSISLRDPSATGITVTNAPCCPVQSDGQCVPGKVPCSNREHYAFFDNYHPTSVWNLATASRSYNATLLSDASPVDIRHLVLQ